MQAFFLHLHAFLCYPKNMSTQTTPYIGMPITYTIGSDSRPGLIVFVNPLGRKFAFVELSTANVENGHIYTDRELITLREPPEDEQNSHTLATLRKDNTWRIMNSKTPVSLGHARLYRDPSF